MPLVHRLPWPWSARSPRPRSSAAGRRAGSSMHEQTATSRAAEGEPRNPQSTSTSVSTVRHGSAGDRLAFQGVRQSAGDPLCPSAWATRTVMTVPVHDLDRCARCPRQASRYSASVTKSGKSSNHPGLLTGIIFARSLLSAARSRDASGAARPGGSTATAGCRRGGARAAAAAGRSAGEAGLARGTGRPRPARRPAGTAAGPCRRRCRRWQQAAGRPPARLDRAQRQRRRADVVEHVVRAEVLAVGRAGRRSR